MRKKIQPILQKVPKEKIIGIILMVWAIWMLIELIYITILVFYPPYDLKFWVERIWEQHNALIAIILAFVSGFMLYKKNTLGWLLSIALSSLIVIQCGYLFLSFSTWEFLKNPNFTLLYYIRIGFILLFSRIIYVLTRLSFREKYQASTREKWKAVTLASVLLTDWLLLEFSTFNL